MVDWTIYRAKKEIDAKSQAEKMAKLRRMRFSKRSNRSTNMGHQERLDMIKAKQEAREEAR